MKNLWAYGVALCLLGASELRAQPRAAAYGAEQAGSTAANSPTLSASVSADSVVPRLIQFSGVVKDTTGKVVVGNPTLTFSLYQFPEGGTPLWTETQMVTTDDQGRYTVLLGAASSTGLPLDLFTSGAARWLGVQSQLAGMGESPRVLLVGVPYALKAADAETLGGKPPSAFVTTESQAGVATVGAVPTAGSFSANSPRSTNTGLTVATKEQKNGKATNSTTITGSGTTNFVPLWTSSSSLGNSALFQSSGKIGIGTTAPTQLLQVNGAGGILSSGTEGGLYFQMRDGTTQSAWYGTGNVSRFWRSDKGDIIGVNSAGQVGIGTDSPTQELQVNGQVFSTGSVGGYLFGMRDGGTVTSAWFGSGNVSHFWRSDKGDIIGVTSAGNVGIGTTTPAATLDVNGTANFSGLVSFAGGQTFPNTATLGSNTFVGTETVNGTVSSSSSTSNPVVGAGSNGFAGVVGTSDSGDGVFGESFGSDPGVVGQNLGSGVGDGVFGFSDSGFAGDFDGNLNVTGTILAGGKDFKIDHPLDPANQYLYHASVESSEMKNIYDGAVVLDSGGEAVVRLPDWFQAENADFRYQLTAIGAPAPGLYIAEEVQNNQFRIAGGSPGAKVSWQVTGVRQDAYAKAHPLAVEVEKPATERGYYIHPELYGAPEEKGIEWARHPEMMKRMKEMREKSANLAQVKSPQ